MLWAGQRTTYLYRVERLPAAVAVCRGFFSARHGPRMTSASIDARRCLGVSGRGAAKEGMQWQQWQRPRSLPLSLSRSVSEGWRERERVPRTLGRPSARAGDSVPGGPEPRGPGWRAVSLGGPNATLGSTRFARPKLHACPGGQVASRAVQPMHRVASPSEWGLALASETARGSGSASPDVAVCQPDQREALPRPVSRPTAHFVISRRRAGTCTVRCALYMARRPGPLPAGGILPEGACRGLWSVGA